MDRIQFDIAYEITALNCTLTGQLKDGKGNFCALGGLYTAIDPDWAVRDDGEDNAGNQDIYDAIAETFGITLTRLWTANDNELTMESRRIAVKAELTRQLEAS